MPLHAIFTLGSDVHGSGWTATPALDLDLDLDLGVRGWGIAARAGGLAATRDNHGQYHDVLPAHATAERPAYNAPGGAAGWALRLGASRRFGMPWVGGFLRSVDVSGVAIEASPLVRQRRNLTAGLLLSWVLPASQIRVAEDR